jgi:hypothetical protein
MRASASLASTLETQRPGDRGVDPCRAVDVSDADEVGVDATSATSPLVTIMLPPQPRSRSPLDSAVLAKLLSSLFAGASRLTVLALFVKNAEGVPNTN